MAANIDPAKLKSLADLAKKFGYHVEHLRALAESGRLKAWFVSRTMWVSTEELMREYMRSRKPAGRRPSSSKPK